MISLHRRQPRQEATSYLGIIVFVASWAMLFAALFMSYAVLRIRSASWPPQGVARLPVGLPLLATGVLAASSALLQVGLSRLRGGAAPRYAAYVAGTMALGALFLAIQCTVWWTLWQGGLHVDSGHFGGIFYLLTCFHALHVLVGLGFLGWLLVDALRSPALVGRLGRLGVVTVYWHFVGVVWAVMFVIVYLV